MSAIHRRAAVYARASAFLAAVVADEAVRRAQPSLARLADRGITDRDQALDTLVLVRGLPELEDDVVGALYDILEAEVASEQTRCLEYAEQATARLLESRARTASRPATVR